MSKNQGYTYELGVSVIEVRLLCSLTLRYGRIGMDRDEKLLLMSALLPFALGHLLFLMAAVEVDVFDL